MPCFKPHQGTGGSGVSPPGYVPHALCALLAREQDIEGNVGTAEVKWSTGQYGTSKVYASITSDTGPWTTVVDDATLTQCHSFTFAILGIQQHWYYVESVSDLGGTETSTVQTFLPDGIPHTLCATMGKELACEGLNGIIWVNWATGWPGTSKIYVSIVSDTGPWITVINDSTLTKCHTFTFPMLQIGKHWFYVETTSAAAGVETSAVLTFCTSSIILIAPPDLFTIFAIPSLVPLNLAPICLTNSLDWVQGAGDNAVNNTGDATGLTYQLVTKAGDQLEILDEDTLAMATPTHAFV